MVAIIALLISVLMPSLAQVRRHACETSCGVQLSQILRAESSYQTMHEEWIPGSPLTTGRWFVEQTDSARANRWDPFAAGFNRSVVEWHDYATPLRAIMEGRRVAPMPPDEAGADRLRGGLFQAATDNVFHCPSNPHLSHPWPTGGRRMPVIRATSYLTMWPMVKGGPRVYRDPPGRADPPYRFAVGPGAIDDEIVPPDDYVPRHNKLGRESMKVFLADGLRFFDPDCAGTTEDPTIDCDRGTIDYNTRPSDTKGVFAGTPPAVRNFASDGNESREYTTARQYSYRHGGGTRINGGFFDGHVGRLSVDVRGKQSDGGGFRGSAVEPKWYWPSGSVVLEPNALHLTGIAPGTVLP